MPIINQGSSDEVVIVDSSGNAVSTLAPADGATEPSREIASASQPFLYNGSTIDRARGAAASGLLLGAQKVVPIDSVSWQQSFDEQADIKLTCPSNKVWSIHSIYVRCLNDATSGNRQLHCVVNDGNEDTFNFVYTMAMVASTNYFWLLTPYLNYTAMSTENRAFGGIPPNLILKEGYWVNILDANTVSSSDSWDVSMYVNQWDE